MEFKWEIAFYNWTYFLRVKVIQNFIGFKALLGLFENARNVYPALAKAKQMQEESKSDVNEIAEFINQKSK